jgi:hypothetical protein
MEKQLTIQYKSGSKDNISAIIVRLSGAHSGSSSSKRDINRTKRSPKRVIIEKDFEDEESDDTDLILD